MSSGSFIELSLFGLKGILLPLVSVVLVLVSGFLIFRGVFKIIATQFGHMSYGMYLLHPLVFIVFQRNSVELIKSHPLIGATCIVLVTALLALVVERVFERPINDFGKRLFRPHNPASPVPRSA